MREGEFRLTAREGTELRDRLRSRTQPAEDVRRARLILLLAQGKSYLAIRQVLGCNPNYISRWKGRFEAERLVGLYSHHSKRVEQFLAAHSKLHLHYTPTYSSWLNQVELWFGKIERDVIARGVFTSVSDLKRKLMRYIRHYNKSPRTVKWKYADPSRHISTQSVGTGH